MLIKVNQKYRTKDLGLGSSVTCGECVRNPTTPIQRIVPYFNLTQRYLFSEEIEYLTFWFWKSFEQTIYIHIHVSIYLLIIYHVNIIVKEYLHSKHVGYKHKYYVRKHVNKGKVYNSMWVKYLLDRYHVSTNYYHVRKHANKWIVYNSMWVKYLLDRYHGSTNYRTNKLQHRKKRKKRSWKDSILFSSTIFSFLPCKKYDNKNTLVPK